MSSGISREDWLKALEDANVPTENDQGAVTVQEFADMMGVTRWMAGYNLRKLLSQGRAVRTHKRAMDTGGRCKTHVAYRLVEPEAKRKTA